MSDTKINQSGLSGMSVPTATNTQEYADLLKPGVRIKLDVQTATIAEVNKRDDNLLQIHVDDEDGDRTYFITGVDAIAKYGPINCYSLEEIQIHQQSGEDLDINVVEDAAKQIRDYPAPRQIFNKHMQEAKAAVWKRNLPAPTDIFHAGLSAGVELTLDVLKQHGYKLVDTEGNVVNAEDQPSLAFGIWHVPFSEEPTH